MEDDYPGDDDDVVRSARKYSEFVRGATPVNTGNVRFALRVDEAGSASLELMGPRQYGPEPCVPEVYLKTQTGTLHRLWADNEDGIVEIQSVRRGQRIRTEAMDLDEVRAERLALGQTSSLLALVGDNSPVVAIELQTVERHNGEELPPATIIDEFQAAVIAAHEMSR